MERVRSKLNLPAVATVGVLGAAIVVVAASFGETYDAWTYLLAVVFAVASAAAVSAASRRLGAPLGVALLASALGVLLIGTAIVEGAVPPMGLPDFVRTVTSSWRLMLDVSPPLQAGGRDLAVPFMTGWVAMVVATETALRTRSVLLPLAGPTLMLVVTALFAVGDETLTTRTGVALFALAVLYLMLRVRQTAASRVRSSPTTRALVITGLAASALVAPALAEQIPVGGDRERVTLRENYEPAFDPQRLASPLSLLKESLRPATSDDQLFTIQGPRIERIRLAILPEYDDVVFTMASRDRTAFRPIGSELPKVAGEPTGGTAATHTVTIDQLAGPWLPVPGSPTALVASNGMTQDELRFDPSDANVLTRERLVPGMQYEVAARPVPSFEPGLAPPVPGRAGVADGRLATLADSITGGTPEATARLERLISWFQREGFYDAEALPGHNTGRLEEFLFADGGIVGYDEQYAAAFAVLAQHLGLDVRVVVGYEVDDWADGRAVVSRADMRAWNEVNLRGIGWTTVDITPDQPKQADETVVSAGESAGRLPEPPPTDDRAVTTTTVPEEEDEQEDEAEQTENEAGSASVAAVAAGTAGGLLILLGLAVLAIVVVKRRRRARRRRAAARRHRVTGAWLEFVDRGVDLGHEPRPGATIRETGTGLARHLRVDDREVATLVAVADRAGFDAGEPSDAEVHLAWNELVRLERLASSSRPWHQRLRAAVRTTSLRRASRRRRLRRR